METYPSGTDMQEIQDQAANYEYFLSLIVNFEGKYTAKLSFSGNVDSDIFYQTKFGKYKYNSNKEIVFYTNVDVEMECDDAFKDLLNHLKSNELPTFNYREPLNSSNRSMLTYGKSPYKNLYEEGYSGFPEYTGKYQQRELFKSEITNTSETFDISKITGEYLVREILTSKDVNLFNLKANSTFSLVKAYTLIPNIDDNFEDILSSISIINSDIIATSLKITNKYVEYEKTMISAYQKIVDYLLTFNKTDTNGFVTRFIIIILEELNMLFDTDEEYDSYIKERGLLNYYDA